jgi:outer membrane immunogenic protein
MKRLLLASTALAIGGQAFAADMAVKAPPVAAAPFSWTGCYVGGHLGVGSSREKFSDPGYTFSGVPRSNFAPPGGSIAVNSAANGLAGTQVGCDDQFATHWVLGLAGDFSWAGITGQATDPFFTGKSGNPITLVSKTDELATVTGRLGYAWDRFTVYGKGGAAWAQDKDTIQNLVSLNNFLCVSGGFVACNPTGNDTRIGWTAGVGFEWALTDYWSAMVEYDHYGFGTKGVSLFDPAAGVRIGGVAILANVSEGIDAVKVGINYRFGLGR